MYRILMPVYWSVIVGLPFTLGLAPTIVAESLLPRMLALFAAPFAFGLLYMGVCGTLSWPHRWAIQPGEFPRELAHPIYGSRRLYGLCWAAIYYFTPLYNLFLSIPVLRVCLFRLFGYRGSTDFTTYADTWIRDLPLLQFDEGAYLSNKATFGTNLYSVKANTILVGPIHVGRGGVIGHGAIIGFGASIGQKSELGMASLFGLGATLGDRSRTGPACLVNHMARIGNDCIIEPTSYVGLRVVIHDGLRIPAGACIPKDVELRTQEDVKDFLSSETRDLNRLRMQLTEILNEGGRD